MTAAGGGAAGTAPRRRRRIRLAVRAASFGLVGAVAAVGCGHQGAGPPNRPVRLVDGSAAPALPRVLARLAGHVVRSRVLVGRVSTLRAARACATSLGDTADVARTRLAVERIGRHGASVTFRDRSGRLLLGCDRARRRAAGEPAWCARSVGRLVAKRLRDPRVDLLCRDGEGNRLGFAWIDPAPRTQWVVSRLRDDDALESIAAGLPVRVVTDAVDVDTSTASFRLEEYDRAGALVRSWTLHAGVAG